MDEAFETGFEPVKVAIPLAIGGAVHAGLAWLMRAANGIEEFTDFAGGPWWKSIIEAAVGVATDHFKSQCTGRALDLDALESQSFVFNEQLALTEALVRLAGTRVIPRLLELYEVLEVERMDVAPLVQDQPYLDRKPGGAAGIGFPFEDIGSQWSVLFRSIPDALVRSRADGDLYVISWKTTSEFSASRDQDARTDMQGLSECWALEARLRGWAQVVSDFFVGKELPGDDESVRKVTEESREELREIPAWFVDHWLRDGNCAIRGVQMIYLVKGQRRKVEQGGQVTGYRTASSLITGLRKIDPTGLLAPEFATERYYTCTDPHPFRYAKGGQCPGGVNHKRGEDWESVNMWETDGGVRGWMELLERGGAGGAGIVALDSAWVMPVPHFRTSASVKSWERQTKAAEARHARDLIFIRDFEDELREHPEDSDLWTAWNAELDRVFPQSTERCGDWFHRRCPAWDLCHGAPHVAQDPVGSGLYMPKTQYMPDEETVNG